ncbi:hypothetical protein CGCVW01_v012883 [Colletotrichum viniferum]|nr:hypothetical protein CGCVW01_v012883 [Colletotrichum viniferum]
MASTFAVGLSWCAWFCCCPALPVGLLPCLARYGGTCGRAPHLRGSGCRTLQLRERVPFVYLFFLRDLGGKNMYSKCAGQRYLPFPPANPANPTTLLHPPPPPTEAGRRGLDFICCSGQCAPYLLTPLSFPVSLPLSLSLSLSCWADTLPFVSTTLASTVPSVYLRIPTD